VINLLPDEVKASYRYARLNVGLRRWVVMCLVALAGLVVIGTYGLLSIQQSVVQYQDRVAASEKLLQQENYSATQAKVKDISNSFQLMVKVLKQEVLFSQLLKQVAATIPANANLTALNISQTSGAIDISAITTDYNTATQVQVNLADPANKIFSRADIVNISCNGNTTDPQYPCTVTVRALFSSDNPFLFINSQGSTR
jgi:Tfp pilus assembly protein PilN